MVASHVAAQPPGEEPPRPPPPADTGPPPPAPEPSWAPPLPVEEPPAEPAAEPASPEAKAEEAPAGQPAEPEMGPSATTMEIYGFAMLDIGFDFGHIGDPNWQDVLRPTRLPAFEDQFGTGPRTFESVRQSRFGVKTHTPTAAGDIDTQFEFELFGVGVDEGQTTFRLRHFYGEWRGIVGGQTWSLFMDPDVFPASIEYWGPPGMVFFRNVQLSYKFLDNDTWRVAVGLERPGGTADTAGYAGRIELEGVVPRFPAPDVSAEARYTGKWGYVELAGIVRWLKWDDVDNTPPLIEGEAFGWGLNLSSNLKLGPALLKLQAVYGEAIENYMNDASTDIGPRVTNDPARPLDGDSLPVFGLVAFADFDWSKQFTSTAGYSFIWIDNSEGQADDAFHMGHYALANLLYHPVEKLFFGPELQFGRRSNARDGFDANDYRVQFSIQYKFSEEIKGRATP